MRRAMLVMLVLAAMVLSLVVVSCSDSEPASTDTTTAASTDATTASTAGDQAPIELTVAYGDNKTPVSDAELLPWMDELEQKSDGRLKVVQVYYAGQLIESSEIYDAAVRGTVDIAMNTASMNLNRWTVMDILSITPIDSQCELISKAYMDVFTENQDVFDREFDDSKLLAIFGTIPNPPGLPLAFANKQPQSLEELKGLKICGPGAYNMDYLAALGMSPATIPPPDQYSALEKGIVDATVLDPIFYEILNFGDVIKYQITNIGFGGSPWFITMNSEKFDSLPEDLQQILVDVCATFGDRRDQTGYDAKMAIIDDAVASSGLVLYELPQEEIAKLKDVEATVIDAKLAEYSADLPEARDIFDAWVAARAMYAR